MRFETLPRGTKTANLDGFTIDLWKMGGGKGAWNVMENKTGEYVGGSIDESSPEVAEINAIDCWRENAHPIVTN